MISLQHPVPEPASGQLPASSSPPSTIHVGEVERYLLQKVEGNTPYICYAGVGVLFPLTLLQPEAAAFLLFWWSLWWILYFSLYAITVEHYRDPTHWSQGPWFRKHVDRLQVKTSESGK